MISEYIKRAVADRAFFYDNIYLSQLLY